MSAAGRKPDEPLAKPSLRNDFDALIFVLIVESDPKYNLDKVKTGMRAMHASIHNRFIYNWGPSFGAPQALNYRDIIGALGQFQGFSSSEGVLTASSELTKRLDERFEIANDNNDKRQKQFRDFIEAAEDIAAAFMEDPFEDRGGSFGWKSAGSGSPGKNFQLLGTIAGNSFYTLGKSYKEELRKAVNKAANKELLPKDKEQAPKQPHRSPKKRHK
jgi:hypothetical protein